MGPRAVLPFVEAVIIVVRVIDSNDHSLPAGRTLARASVGESIRKIDDTTFLWVAARWVAVTQHIGRERIAIDRDLNTQQGVIRNFVALFGFHGAVLLAGRESEFE